MHRKSCQLITYLPTGVVSASTIQALNQCPNVKRVVFTRTSFKEPFPEIPHITRLPKLRILEVLKCNYPMLHLIPLTLFRNTLSHLIYIRICEIFGNVDFLISKILLKCPLLKRLDLEKNHELTCEALRNISSCKLLTRLSVSHCQNVDKKAIQYVAEGCPQLQHLDVSGIPMSDELFRQILRCRTLTLLMMTFTDVSVIDLDLISTNIPGLKELLIGPKYKFGHDCTRDIKQHMPHLNIWAPQFASDIQDYYTQKYEYVNLHTGYKDDPSDLMK
ncbi:hypothetical protein B7P43_G03354 [Cryptotermes secundus]|uniref:Uncharacterized protein n=2 Tax=Cryptotermes secundus TaxID=105785 RepID=A0A2J7QXY2_9NEOP|nr:hypothetical protein B7P43_G03354 [Cryptotermes secundus]